jgi:hypothetical protein
LVEQLICNQQVIGSSPIAGSPPKELFGGEGDAPTSRRRIPEIVVHTREPSPEESVGQILDELLPPAIEVIRAEPQMGVVKQIAVTLNGAYLMTSRYLPSCQAIAVHEKRV